MSSLDSISSTPEVPTTIFSDQKIENQREREQRFLAILCLIFILPYTLIGLGIIPVFIVTGQVAALILAGLQLIGVCICGVGYWCSRDTQKVRLGSWLLVTYTNVAMGVFCFLFGVGIPIAAGFLSTLFISLMLLPTWATWFFNVSAFAFTVALYLLDGNGYQPLITLDKATTSVVAMGFWAIILFTPVLLGTFLWSQQKRSFNLLLTQSERLGQALNIIENKRQLGEMVSERISSIMVALNSTAAQQAMGSQQQAAGLSQLTQFLEELTRTASNIVAEAGMINQTLSTVTDSTQQVKTLVGSVIEVGESGALAVKRTIESSQNVNGLYAELTTVLDELQHRSVQIEKVVQLTSEISNETHLLSLNAAIEAAGAGAFGRRFSVIASEVKGLADRSLAATKEIAIILGQFEECIQQAVQIAENGQRQTQSALSVANESGTVMSKLVQAIKHNAGEIKIIEQVVNRISEQVQDISYATSHQHSASSQAVETVHSIGSIARQSATGSMQIVSTTEDLEKLSSELKTALVAQN